MATILAAIAFFTLCSPCIPIVAIGIVNLLLSIVIIISLFLLNAPCFTSFLVEKGSSCDLIVFFESHLNISTSSAS